MMRGDIAADICGLPAAVPTKYPTDVETMDTARHAA